MAKSVKIEQTEREQKTETFDSNQFSLNFALQERRQARKFRDTDLTIRYGNEQDGYIKLLPSENDDACYQKVFGCDAYDYFEQKKQDLWTRGRKLVIPQREDEFAGFVIRHCCSTNNPPSADYDAELVVSTMEKLAAAKSIEEQKEIAEEFPSHALHYAFEVLKYAKANTGMFIIKAVRKSTGSLPANYTKKIEEIKAENAKLTGEDTSEQ